jgi:hypothetical protein
VLGFFITRLGDIYGRKWPTWISIVVSLPIQVGLLLSKNLTLSVVLFFLLGCTVPGKI